MTTLTFSQDHRYDPPWNTPPESAVMFTIPGIDNVPDLYGDINDPQLVVFFAGNQFMVIDDLITEFKKEYPQYQRVFAESDCLINPIPISGKLHALWETL